jgi:TPR repeat protein
LLREWYWGRKNEQEAFRWYRLAADQGHAEAQSVLSIDNCNSIEVDMIV